MTTRPFATLLFASALAVIVACGSSTTTNVTQPTTLRCQPSVTASSSAFPAAGGTGTASVTISRECEWSASAAAPWIVITSGSRGQGEGTIAFRVDANADPLVRRAALSVGGSQVELSQDAAPCRFVVSTLSSPIPADGGETSIDVQTHQACAWNAAAEASWAGVAPQSGRGNASLRVMVGANDGGMRSTSLTIASERVTLTQLGRQQPPTPPPSPSPTPPPSPAPSPSPVPSPSPAPSPSPTPEPSPTPSPVPTTPINLGGKVSSVSGACPVLTFGLGDKTVFTTTTTAFVKMQCRDLKVGMKVKVDGFLMSDGTVRADRVEKD